MIMSITLIRVLVRAEYIREHYMIESNASARDRSHAFRVGNHKVRNTTIIAMPSLLPTAGITESMFYR